MKNKLFVLCILTVILCSISTFTNAQCAMCKASVESNIGHDKNAKRVKGLNNGIIYMAGIPYLLFGGMAYMWYRSSKKETLRKAKIKSIVNKAMN